MNEDVLFFFSSYERYFKDLNWNTNQSSVVDDILSYNKGVALHSTPKYKNLLVNEQTKAFSKVAAENLDSPKYGC